MVHLVTVLLRHALLRRFGKREPMAMKIGAYVRNPIKDQRIRKSVSWNGGYGALDKRRISIDIECRLDKIIKDAHS